MARPHEETGPAPRDGGDDDPLAQSASEILDLQTPDGPLPGVPIAPRNGRGPAKAARQLAPQAPTAAEPCVRCLVARAVLMAALAVALGLMIYMERRKATPAAPSA